MRKLLIAILVAPVTLHAQSTWYVVNLAGSPVGYMHETRSATDTGVRVRGQLHMALNRLGSQVLFETVQSSIESRGGVLRSLEAETRMSQQTVGTTVAIRGLRATVTVRAGEQPFSRDIELKDSVVGPAAVHRLTLDRLRSVGDSVQFSVWDPQLNAPATVTRVLIARDSLRQFTERSTAAPIVTTMWVNSGGTLVRSEFDLPFGRVVTVLADSIAALGTEAGGELPDETYERTLIKTAVKLPRARNIETIRLSLTLPDTLAVMPDLTSAGQRVLTRSRNHTVIEVSRRRPRVKATFPVAVTAALREYLEPNAYVQSSEPQIVALARQIVGGTKDLFSAALALERWVSEHMQLDLGVAFAPSVEVFERRRGTCVAYATLLATLARAVGIPSRVAAGYVYVNGMFGGHMWTEVLVGSDWIPIDAAITATGPADAARFAFSWGSLADGPGILTSGPGAQLYGQLNAKVLAYRIGSTTHTIPMDARPYTITGNTYRNEWLGIEVSKPDGFRFSELDETWPSSTVLAFSKGSEVVRVRSKLLDPWDPRPSSPTTVANGPEMWVIEATSPNASQLIARVRSDLTKSAMGHTAR